MKIDVTPLEIIADETWTEIINLREIPCLYVFKTPDGDEYSTNFDPKSIDEFLPSRTVSETIASWEEGIQRQYDLYMKAFETRQHPYWTREVEREKVNPWDRTQYDTVPVELTKRESERWKEMADRIKPKIGKITFHKIVPQKVEKAKKILSRV